MEHLVICNLEQSKHDKVCPFVSHHYHTQTPLLHVIQVK